jgi:membrane-associated phospholipid phosphatase
MGIRPSIVRAVAVVSFGTAFAVTAAAQPVGPRFETTTAATTTALPTPASNRSVDRVRFWNQVAIDASGLDHTPLRPGETGRVFGEQLGPGRSSRAVAIVQIAVFDAVNSILGGYRSYTNVPRAPQGASVDAAIAVASRDTLVAMFPSQRGHFDLVLAADLLRLRSQSLRSLADGALAGRRASAAILARRANDGSQHAEERMDLEYIPGPDPGEWRQDPISLIPLALGSKWGAVRPFVMTSGAQFRTPPPPALTSAAYTAAYDEVKRLGGDGETTATERNAEQTQVGIYWAYDGTPSLCAPPRLYNQIAKEISKRSTDVREIARLLALVNVAMADAGIAIWESKYHYKLWRPVTGIREADQGTGPTGLGDGNPATLGDVLFSPLGAPASNLTGPNFTPPFPAYPSGHAGFGAALFQVLRRHYGTDRIPFTFVSDEFNGVTVGNDGEVRPLLPRSFQTLSQAEEENGQSRIYLGIHWSFDKTEGITQGRRIADFVFANAFRPVR